MNARANKDRHSKQTSSVLRSTAPSRLQSSLASRDMLEQEQRPLYNSAPLPTLSNTKSASKLYLGDKTPRPQQPVSCHDDASASTYTARSVLVAPLLSVCAKAHTHRRNLFASLALFSVYDRQR